MKTHPLLLHFLLLIGEHRLLIVSGGFALHEGDRAGGTGGQAVTQTVAVIVAHELRLAVHHSDGPLVARCGTPPQPLHLSRSISMILLFIFVPSLCFTSGL